MKAILYIVTILVAIGAGILTFQHSRKFVSLQTVRLQTMTNFQATDADAYETEKKRDAEKATLVKSEQAREVVMQSVATLEAEGATAKRTSDELDSTLKTQEQEIAELNKTMEEIKLILSNLGGDISLDNVGDKIAEIEADKKAKLTKLEETLTLIGAAEKSLAVNRAEADRFAKRIIERSARIGRNAMEAVVTAVDQDWGFLVIGAGSNSGFTPQSDLLVMRDGRLIGRVRPSSIELNQTIAEIDFASLSPGVRLQAGDRVMLKKPNTN